MVIQLTAPKITGWLSPTSRKTQAVPSSPQNDQSRAQNSLACFRFNRFTAASLSLASQ